MDPQAYLALSPEEQNTYLKSLTAEQRLQFVSSVDEYEQAQIAAAEGRPNARQIANPPVNKLPLASVAPLAPSTPSEREDPADAISEIKPSREVIAKAQDDKLRPLVSKLTDRMTSLSSVAATFTDMANLSDPASTEIAPSAIAQGVNGAVQGAALGPLGALAGGLLGTIKGAVTAGNQREGYEQQEALKKRRALTGLRVAPTIQETGGIVEVDGDTEIEIPIQAEVGEVMLLPDGKLVDSMADETHKEMAKEGENEVTDVIQSGTMIFSNSKKRLIDLSKIKDDVFTITRGTYSEEGNVPSETITMGDVYGEKGKVTPAFLAKKIRRMFPIVENPVEQYEIETNKENMGRRAQLLRPVMEMQEGVYEKFEYEKPQKFELGGMVKKSKPKKRTIPKYETGTDGCGVGFKKDAEGKCVPDIAALSGMKPEEIDPLLTALDDDPDYKDIVRKSVTNYQAMMSGDVPKGPLDDLDPEAYYLVTGEKKPLTAARKTATIVGDDLVTDDTVQNTDPEIVVPGATGPMSVPESVEKPVVVDPKITSPRISDAALDRSDQIFENQHKQVADNYATSLGESQNLFRSQRFRNFAILASKLGGIGMQNPNVTPEYKGTEHVDGMFPQITESQIQGQINPIRQGQNRVVSAVADSGISATKIGSALGSTQAKLIDAESEIRDKALGVNQSQKAKRHERLQSIRDFNTNAEVVAENNTRSNRNSLIAQVGEVGADSLKAGGELKTAWSERKQELDKWRAENKNTITQSEYDGILKKEQIRLEREWNDKIKTGIEDLLKNMIKTG